MANVRDVAAYIVQARGRMSTMKMQKLVYYSQAWSLVWTETRLFPERIEAWANGPVVPDLYRLHRGEFEVLPPWPPGGNPEALSEDERNTVNLVLDFYGTKDPQTLSDLTHMEDPWRLARARAGNASGEPGNEEITLDSMLEYYSSISAK
jgi:uncharacterized phage-associated protein